MNESSNNPAGERTGIGEAVSTALRQPSLLRVMLFLAATIVVLAAMFETFPETRWLAGLMTTRPAADAPVPSVRVERAG